MPMTRAAPKAAAQPASALDTTLEARIRRALLETHAELPRPVCDIELPLKLNKLLGPQVMKRLKPAAVLVPLVRRESGLQVLLTRRADHLKKHSGQVSFPGGRCEPGDVDIAATALREAQEEVGLDPASVEIIGYLHDYPTVTGFRVTPVVGVFDAPSQYLPDPGEVAEVFEVPAAHALAADSYQQKYWNKDGLKLPFFELSHDEQRIWGATAGMLRNFQQMLAAAP